MGVSVLKRGKLHTNWAELDTLPAGKPNHACRTGKARAAWLAERAGIQCLQSRGPTRHNPTPFPTTTLWQRTRMTFWNVDWIFLSLFSLPFLPSHQCFPSAREKDDTAENQRVCFKSHHCEFASTWAWEFKKLTAWRTQLVQDFS